MRLTGLAAEPQNLFAGMDMSRSYPLSRLLEPLEIDKLPGEFRQVWFDHEGSHLRLKVSEGVVVKLNGERVCAPAEVKAGDSLVVSFCTIEFISVNHLDSEAPSKSAITKAPPPFEKTGEKTEEKLREEPNEDPDQERATVVLRRPLKLPISDQAPPQMSIASDPDKPEGTAWTLSMALSPSERFWTMLGTKSALIALSAIAILALAIAAQRLMSARDGASIEADPEVPVLTETMPAPDPQPSEAAQQVNTQFASDPETVSETSESSLTPAAEADNPFAPPSVTDRSTEADKAATEGLTEEIPAAASEAPPQAISETPSPAPLQNIQPQQNLQKTTPAQLPQQLQKTPPVQQQPVRRAAPAQTQKQQQPVRRAAPAQTQKQQQPVRRAAPAQTQKQQQPVRRTAPAQTQKQQQPVRRAAPARTQKQQQPVRRAAPTRTENILQYDEEIRRVRPNEPVIRRTPKPTPTQ